MKLQGVDTVKEIAIVKVICILKSNNIFNKNEIIKFCHFATFLMLPCCPVFQQNQYGLKSFCKASLEEHFYLIILQSDKQFMVEKDFLKFGYFLMFKGTFLWYFVEIVLVVKEEMMFKAKS